MLQVGEWFKVLRGEGSYDEVRKLGAQYAQYMDFVSTDEDEEDEESEEGVTKGERGGSGGGALTHTCDTGGTGDNVGYNFFTATREGRSTLQFALREIILRGPYNDNVLESGKGKMLTLNVRVIKGCVPVGPNYSSK